MRKKVDFRNWDVDPGSGFELINNQDSIQYVNEDASRVIYFSVLHVSGNDIISNEVIPDEPKIIEDANGWQLKGIKKSMGQVLVCVISYKNQDDTKWARVFFDSIKYKDAR